MEIIVNTSAAASPVANILLAVYFRAHKHLQEKAVLFNPARASERGKESVEAVSGDGNEVEGMIICRRRNTASTCTGGVETFINK